MKRKLLISTFVTALSLLNSSLIASDHVLDEMEKHAITVSNETYPDGLPICTSQNIEIFERDLKISVPNQLQRFWEKFGHVWFPARNIITPHIDDCLKFVESARNLGVPEEWLPLRSSDGNYYCIHLETGKVGYWDFYTLCFSDNPDDQWESFFDWIERDWLPLIES